MPCAVADYSFAVLLVVFVAASGVATWWHGSLVKLLQLRHPNVHAILGSPSLPRDAESDQHAIAILRFIFSGDFKRLHDEQVNRHIKVLVACSLLSILSVAGFAGLAFMSSTPEALVKLQCWGSR
jgi:hypothetical protein